MKKVIILLFTFLLIFPTILMEGSILDNMAFKLTPAGGIPLGSSSDSFKFGGGAGVEGRYLLSKFPGVFIIGDLGYSIFPIKASNSVSVINFGAGGGMIYSISPKLYAEGFTSSGGYYSTLNGETGVNAFGFYGKAGLGVGYFILPSINIGLNGIYEYYSGMYNGLKLAIGLTYYPGKKPSGVKKPQKKIKKAPAKPKPLKKEEEAPIGLEGLEHISLKNVTFKDIFPVFFKYYDNHPVGSAVIKNVSDKNIEDVKVSLFVKQYMDAPRECINIDKLKAGEEKRIDLSALFTEKVLEITEGTKVTAQIFVSYKQNDKKYSGGIAETIRLYDRNATQWDDNRKAAAFVTAKDPAVLKFSKNIAGLIKGKGSKAVNKNLRMAMGIHEALALYGLSYVVDPKTPYKDFSKNKEAVDFLQFPRQTLEYRAGDCDDLSILTCSLMEAVGVETAFITIPGHIFMAFSLDMTPEEARKKFSRADELIFKGGKAWVPVEVTMISGGFLKAWQEGAKEWREAVAREVAGFYPMHDSWKIYEPVGLPGSTDINLPNRDKVEIAYLKEVIRFIDREIYPQVAKLQREIKKSGGSARSINKLGVLYARYGLYDRAQREFNRVLSKNSNYVPSLINLGNIHYLNKDIKGALSYYTRAYRAAPDNPKVLLCVARANHELENYGTVRETYDKLKVIDPDLAMQFAYLDLRGEEASRAASMAGIKEVVIWDE